MLPPTFEQEAKQIYQKWGEVKNSSNDVEPGFAEILANKFKQVLSDARMEFHETFVYGKRMYILHKGKKKEMFVYLDNNRDKLMWISSKTKAFLIDLYFTSTFCREDTEIETIDPGAHYFGVRQFDEEIFFIFDREELKNKYLNLFKIYSDELRQEDPNYFIYFSNINKLHALHSTENGTHHHTYNEILSISEKVGLINKHENAGVLNTCMKYHNISNQKHLSLACVDDYFSIQYCNRSLQPIFEQYSEEKIGDVKKDSQAILKKVMSSDEFKKFLRSSQKETEIQIIKILKVYKGDLSFFDFCKFLYDSSLNNISRDEYLEEDHPLKDYFCYSSHNTYLSGNQLSSDCKVERYLEDLEDGVKCVEIDVHNDGKQPIVTHAFKGAGFCKPVTFENVIKTIRSYSIKCNMEGKPHFPIILSIENHASNENREQMLHILTRYFGKDLFYLAGNETEFPSPSYLKGKIIIKTSSKESEMFNFKKKLNIKKIESLSSTLDSMFDATKTKVFQDKHLQEKFSKFEKLKEDLEIRKHKFNSRIQQYEQVFIPISSMAKVTTIFKSEEGAKNPNQSQFVCTSLTNAKVVKESQSEIIKYTSNSWLRTYPIGTEVNSYNYDPTSMLKVGAQIIALNTQTKDDYAWCMYRYFCAGHESNLAQKGYILKPIYLRKPENFKFQKRTYIINIQIINSHAEKISMRFIGPGISTEMVNATEVVATNEMAPTKMGAPKSIQYKYENPDESFIIFDIGTKYRDCVALRFVSEGYRILEGRNKHNFMDCGVRILIHCSLEIRD